MRTRRLVHRLAVELRVGAGEVDELEQAQLGVDFGGLEGTQAVGPGVVDHHHLAGFDLRARNGAPTTSSAGVSDANTQPPSSRRPRHSGRKPWGSRTPMTR